MALSYWVYRETRRKNIGQCKEEINKRKLIERQKRDMIAGGRSRFDSGSLHKLCRDQKTHIFFLSFTYNKHKKNIEKEEAYTSEYNAPRD